MEINHLGINEHVFEKALRRKFSVENVKILENTCCCISDVGTNFLSDLYEASIRYAIISNNGETKYEGSVSAIIKTEPSNEISRDIVRKQDLFAIELKFLRDVLPRIRETVDCQLGPSLWYGSTNPHVLVMENLKERGFIMKDRQKGLSFEHCCLAIERIAKLHAGSVAVNEKNPEIMEHFKNGGIVSTKCPVTFSKLMEVSLVRIGNQIKQWSDERCVRAADKIIKLSETILPRCMDVYKYDFDEFCVLNHGDSWINNMMFVENEKGQPIDFLLVDYQMAVYTSPAIDLLYFLNICPEYDIKYDKDDYFLKIYLDTLEETMKSISCKRKPPTMQQLKAAIHKRRVYAILSGIILYLRMMANKEDTEGFQKVEELTYETIMDVFKNPDAVKLTHKMIPIMDERGYFD
ncbi:hypothetical protein WH47_01384 [Habropoda laboriosa]|uniref:CHK kinase-like domain-containing protein n=1 Tax=Habropoda laboriosa TaxID=597456 RepID=A0A0L7QJX5_9HYME|nr:PREDICTED: uncharacterized protein LOC108578151 [Habropoda laboriosa]XP_017796910.1 PREDICTED: uncharacterized protein LOC108578151 [Habropoda laboriosa]XP_017796912.1 PREDICTED: uncharacterized protein LOC108578151 [Habropoda laboriosa]XP_017796913.1 PREDICTED: uncharacterized protein LOC108578151 [Habropoda laboriosa]XP_017796914.1 PREDICTED: uncharacterized protein LOC108578151 [Habropoda laboriosa]XP_017796915.1 PREDICTED: uncharacterized protein LOC108578151 [Habropoda laboriosa]XP_01